MIPPIQICSLATQSNTEIGDTSPFTPFLQHKVTTSITAPLSTPRRPLHGYSPVYTRFPSLKLTLDIQLKLHEVKKTIV